MQLISRIKNMLAFSYFSNKLYINFLNEKNQKIIHMQRSLMFNVSIVVESLDEIVVSGERSLFRGLLGSIVGLIL